MPNDSSTCSDYPEVPLITGRWLFAAEPAPRNPIHDRINFGITQDVALLIAADRIRQRIEAPR